MQYEEGFGVKLLVQVVLFFPDLFKLVFAALKTQPGEQSTYSPFMLLCLEHAGLFVEHAGLFAHCQCLG